MFGKVGFEHMRKEDVDVHRGMYRSRYLYGDCVPMAMALSKAYGEGLVVVWREGRLVHAGTSVSVDRYRDVRGVVDRDAFLSPYSGAG